MKKFFFLSLCFLTLGASANSLNRYWKDINEFHYTSESSTITKKNLATGEIISEIEGRGCANYTGAKGQNFEILLLTELERVQMEVSSAKYDPITKTHSFEKTANGVQSKLSFLIGKGFKVFVTGVNISEGVETKIKCSFVSYKAN